MHTTDIVSLQASLSQFGSTAHLLLALCRLTWKKVDHRTACLPPRGDCWWTCRHVHGRSLHVWHNRQHVEINCRQLDVHGARSSFQTKCYVECLPQRRSSNACGSSKTTEMLIQSNRKHSCVLELAVSQCLLPRHAMSSCSHLHCLFTKLKLAV